MTQAMLLLLWTLVIFTTANTVPQKRPAWDITDKRASSKASDVTGKLQYSFPFPANKTINKHPKAPPGGFKVGKDDSNDTSTTARRPYFPVDCSPEQRNAINGAWDDAVRLAFAQTVTKQGYDYNTPHTQWFGPDWNSEDFRHYLEENFGRIRKIYSGQMRRGYEVYWYCEDFKDNCEQHPDWLAYSGHKEEDDVHKVHTVFCPSFFDIPSLQSLLDQYGNNRAALADIDNFDNSQAVTVYHEVTHYEYLVSDPRTQDFAYDPQDSWDMAKDPNRGTYFAFKNADSYALDALAIYIQQRFRTDYPPVPTNELRQFNAADADYAKTHPPKQIKVGQPEPGFDGGEGWKPPKADKDGKPDPKEWIEIGKTPKSKPTKNPPKGPAYAANGSANGPKEDAEKFKGKCHLHLWEIHTCAKDGFNLFGKLQIWDTEAHEILAPTTAIGIDANKAGHFKSPLPHDMVITGEFKGDYVQFTMGKISFKSKDKEPKDSDDNKPGWCGVGGWDPKEGPLCAGSSKNFANSTRQMDCYFDCPYDA